MKCKDCPYWQAEDELPHITGFMECTRIDENDPDWFAKWHFKNAEDSCEYMERRQGKLHIWGTDKNGDPFNDSVNIHVKEAGRRYEISFQWPNEQEQCLGVHPKDGIWPAIMRALTYGYCGCNVEQLNLSFFYNKEDK